MSKETFKAHIKHISHVRLRARKQKIEQTTCLIRS